MVGPGRGSVCGSLVAYCLDITQIDPIPYNLYFERFLNRQRIEIGKEIFVELENGGKMHFYNDEFVILKGGKKIKAIDLKETDEIDDDFIKTQV